MIWMTLKSRLISIGKVTIGRNQRRANMTVVKIVKVAAAVIAQNSLDTDVRGRKREEMNWH